MAKDIWKDIKLRLAPASVLDRFGHDYAFEGKGSLAICCPSPSHEDTNPSTLVHTAAPGLWKCLGCDAKGSVVDLWQLLDGRPLGELCREMSDAAGLNWDDYHAVEIAAHVKSEVVAEYAYAEPGGQVRYVIQRVEPGRVRKNGKRKSKEFFPRFVGDDKRPLLYRLPQVIDQAEQGGRVYLVEGEKCAEAVESLGLVATTWSGGAAKVARSLQTNGKHLRGAQVVAFPDNNKPGFLAMRQAHKILTALGVDIVIAVIPDLLSGEDVADAIAAGATREQVEMWGDIAEEVETEDAWRDLLTRDKDGNIKSAVGNAALILEYCDETKGLLRLNEIGNVVEVTRRPPWKCAPAQYPRSYRDEDDIAISGWLNNQAADQVAISVSTARDAAFLVASLNRVDPLQEYFAGIVWDGVKRLATAAHTYLDVTSEGASALEGGLCLFDVCFAKWMVGGAARVARPGAKMDTACVLEGEQGSKKSTALAILGGEHYSDQVADIESKDTKLLLLQTWILEVPEFDALSKKEVNTVKAWLSANSDDFRPPYGKQHIKNPRRTIAAATTNETVYLRDPTGDRRFWPIPCGEVDVAALRRDRDQLWAEAAAWVARGATWWLETRAMEDALIDVQASRIELDSWHDTVVEYARGRNELRIAGALRDLGKDLDRQTQGDARRIGRIFRQLGYSVVRVAKADTASGLRKSQRVYCKPDKTAKSGENGPESERTVDKL